MYYIDPDIRKASTLPAAFYRSSGVFDQVKENLLEQSWLYVCDSTDVAEKGSRYPFQLLEGVITDPLVLSRDKDGKLHCLSNVCTHRGKIIVEKAGKGRLLSCGYHGRCFELDGKFKRMPGFKNTLDFPSPSDDLSSIPVVEWLGLVFVSLNPKVPFETIIQPIQDRLSWLPFDTLEYVPSGSKDYHVKANWALYCDNYLEGFHVPFVHPGLAAALDLENYDYELFPYCNLQLGVAKENEPCFDVPEGAKDYGKPIFAYYYWVFPNLMFNFYPWGLSLNIVSPLNHQETLVQFRSYRYKDTEFAIDSEVLNQTELEDEEVVESVQKGVQSRFYDKGRYAPEMEQCVHHFHQLISQFLKQ